VLFSTLISPAYCPQWYDRFNHIVG